MNRRVFLKGVAAAWTAWVSGGVLVGSVLAADDAVSLPVASMRLMDKDVTPTIVLADDASDADKYAASELSEYLGKITGRSPKTVTGRTAPATAKAPLIILGNHPLNRSLDVGRLDPEESVISVEADRVRIAGGRLAPVKLPNGTVSVQDRGTLYGVYHLLNQLGVRWFRPEPWGENVPKRDAIDLPLGRQEFKPAYKYRDSTSLYTWYSNQTPEQADMAARWAVRNFLNTNMSGKYGGAYAVRISHNYENLLPAGKYFKDHPEYFALVNGKRDVKGQPCLGNLEVQKIMAEAAIAQARKNPAAIAVSVSPQDGLGWCECDLCRALDDPNVRAPNGGEKRLGYASMTNRVTYVNNLIARRVGQAVPGMKVAWYAYLATTEVPTKVTKLEPNIFVAVTSMAAAYGNYSKMLEDPKAGGNRNFFNAMKGWSKMTPLLTREYWSGGVSPGPIPMLSVLKDRLTIYRDYRVEGVINESHPSWGTQGILHYFTARLLWNPDIDMDKALEEYCRDYYGPAAGPMLKYHRALDKASLNGPAWFFLGRFITRLYAVDGLAGELGGLMDEALPLAKGQEPYEKRLYGTWAGYKVVEGVARAQRLLNAGKKEEAIAAWRELKQFVDANSASGEVFNTGSASYAWSTMSGELGLPKK